MHFFLAWFCCLFSLCFSFVLSWFSLCSPIHSSVIWCPIYRTLCVNPLTPVPFHDTLVSSRYFSQPSGNLEIIMVRLATLLSRPAKVESVDKTLGDINFFSRSNKDHSHLPNATVSTCDCATSPAPEPLASNQTVPSPSNSCPSVCRICQDNENVEDLTTLCKCTGSIAKYHVSCLERWLSVANADVCELCHERFHTKRKAKPFTEVRRERRWDGSDMKPNHMKRIDVKCKGN